MRDLTIEEVGERFDWARRQGNPKWLWPAVTVAEWHRATVGLEQVIGEVMREGRAAGRLDEDPAVLGLAAYISGTGPLLGHWVSEGIVEASPAVATVLDAHLEHNGARMKMLAVQAIEVVQAFAARGIEATILKGMHTAFEYFPAPSCRPMADIDLAILAVDNERAGEVLERLGFEPGPTAPYPPQRSWHKAGQRREPRTLELVHRNDAWAVDVQTSLNRRYSVGAPPALLDEIAHEVRPRWGPCALAQTLPQPLLTLQLAAHASSPLFSLNLLRLVELIEVVRQDTANGRLAWADLVAAGARADALGHAWPALHMAERLAPGTIPATVLKACERRAPLAVRRVVGRLSPATSHRVARTSVEEHFMWCNSPLRVLRQILSDLTVRNSRSLAELSRVYLQRVSRLANGTLTWR